ncbi:MAG: tetratricopeptide repeat protein [Pseudomonadota bacterium]
MATYKHLPRGKKKPVKDEFIDWTIKVIHFLHVHVKTISIAAGAFFITLVVIFSANYFLKYRENKIANSFYQIQEVTNKEEKIVELKKFVADYSDSETGRVASLELANILFETKQYEAAIAEFERISQKKSYPVLVRIAGFYGLANVLLAQEKYEQAAQTYIVAAEVNHNLNKADSFYQAGLCFEKLADYAKAKEYFEKALDLTQEGQLKNKIEEHLLWLIAQGR